MKRVTLFNITVFLAAMSFLSCSGNNPGVTSDFIPEQYENRIYEVFGMDCPGCHGGLEKLVKKVSLVKHAEANWEEKQLVVYFQKGAELHDEDIYNAIKRANLTAGQRLK